MAHYFDTYSEMQKLKPSGFRDLLRNAVLDVLSLLEKIKSDEILSSKPRVQFIYIHHIFKDEEKQLRVLLQTLQKHFTFISYSEAVNKILNCEIDKPYIAISSDDGLKNNLRAAEILNEYGAKACFFINPSIIGEKNFSVISEHCKNKLEFPPVEFLNWDEVSLLQKSGHEIGSHTMSHRNLAKSTQSEISEDIQKSHSVLLEKCGEAKHFAFPYGTFSDFNEGGRKACFDAGFISCASAERGCHINPENKLANDELCILRDHIILDWRMEHILFFLSRNARKAKPENNFFPYKNHQ